MSRSGGMISSSSSSDSGLTDSSSRLTRKDEISLITGNNEDEKITLQRPQRMHYIEAERIRQEREEAILRAVDIAEEQLRIKKETGSVSTSDGKSTKGGSSWKFW